MGRRLATILRLAFGLFLLAALVCACDPDSVARAFANARPDLLVLALLATLLAYALTAWRWQAVMDGTGSLSYWAYLRHTFTAVFCNNFLPTGFGGDVTRLYNLGRLGVPLPFATGALFLERLLGFLVIGALVFLSSPALWSFLRSRWEEGGPAGRWELVLLFGFILAVVLGMLLLLLAVLSRTCSDFLVGLAERLPWRRIPEFLRDFFSGVRRCAQSRRAVLRTLLISVLLQLAFALAFRLSMQAVGVEVPFLPLFALLQVTSLLGILPITIETAGVREFVFLLFLGHHGYDNSAVLTALLLARLLGILAACPGLAFVFIDGLPRKDGAQ